MPRNPLISAYRKLRYGEPIVVVSGLPRSGTSMAMKMLVAGGLEAVTDEIRTADEDNPKGYYEDERVKDLAQMDDKSWLARGRGKAIKVISFLLKELPASNNYKVVFMRRDIEEILASQQKMLDRRGETNQTEDEKMATLFEGDLFRARYLMKHNTQFEFLEVHYRQALEDPITAATAIAEFLDMGLDVDEMVGVVDPELYRNRKEALASA
jgi:chemotaxis response regulator CheB